MSLKKSVLASAVAMVIAMPAYAVDVTNGGRVHVRLLADKDQDMDIDDNGSRLFWKGSGEMNNGNTAGAHLEFQFNGSNANPFGSTANIGADGDGSGQNGGIITRHANAYVQGGFGKLTVGRQNNPHNKVYKSDMFQRTSGAFELAPWRIGSGVVYSLDAGPVALDVGLQLDGQGSDDADDVDATIIAASFSAGAVDISVSNHSTTEDSIAGEESYTGAGASWTGGALTVAAYVENASEAEIDVFDVGVLFDLGNGVVLGGDIATCENDGGTACGGGEEETRTLIGAYIGLGAGASTYVQWHAYDEQDTDGLTVGYNVSW